MTFGGGELENSCMKTHRHALNILGAFAVAVAAAACSSGGTPSSTNTSPARPASPSATSPASSPASGTAAIAANWTAFFNFKTPTDKRIALLQNGNQFASIIKGQAGQGLASTANAKVLSVSNVTASQATVKYNILLGTTPALTNQTGTAVLQDGTWKVGDGSFCGLLKLEGLKSLPPACASAG
jgi:hypothetical protein